MNKRFLLKATAALAAVAAFAGNGDAVAAIITSTN